MNDDATSLQLLLDSFVAIASEQHEESILEQAVDLARLSTRARYGAAALVEDGRLTVFVHRGLTRAQVEALPHEPEGRGMLAAVLEDKAPIRKDRLQDDARSVGFPLRHVPMAAFLGVPIMFETELLGALYLTKPPGEGLFGEQQELFMQALANQVGVALEAGRLLREKQEINEQLRSANRLKTDFVSMTSHELLSPLTAILGFGRILQRRWVHLPDDRRRHLVDQILEGATRLQRLVTQLLEMNRIEAGALAIHPRAIDVGAVAREVLAGLETPDAPIELRCPDGLLAMADPEHLGQMLTNYVANALRYGAPPFLVEGRAEGSEVELRVRDHGDGVPQDFVPRLFEKFSQANPVAGAERRGFGLGLSIVRALAEAQQGRAWYEPNRPRGACFCISLPGVGTPAPSP